MDEYKRHLRRLALHDDALLEEIAIERGSLATSALDERTVALVRVAETVAVDGAPPPSNMRWRAENRFLARAGRDGRPLDRSDCAMAGAGAGDA